MEEIFEENLRHSAAASRPAWEVLTDKGALAPGHSARSRDKPIHAKQVPPHPNLPKGLPPLATAIPLLHIPQPLQHVCDVVRLLAAAGLQC